MLRSLAGSLPLERFRRRDILRRETFSRIGGSSLLCNRRHEPPPRYYHSRVSESEFDIIEVSSPSGGGSVSRLGATAGGDGSVGLEFDVDGNAVELPEVLGDYRILEEIGSGGMGHVYRAEHRMMARVVALKTLPPTRASRSSAVDRFFAEVRAAARVLHPNIVTAFDAGTEGQIHFLIMEFVDGVTLNQLVEQDGVLSVPDAVRIIRAAGEGLAHAHRTGLVHRDVKPGNVMVARTGEVKVLDLGLAGFAADERSPLKKGKLVGTIEYIAPEQIEDPNAADARADIYSLGGTLYYLLTGHSPYHGDLLSQVRSHRHDDPPQVAGIRPDADLRIDHVLRRMMAKRPEDRYQSIAELDVDLAALENSTAGALPGPAGMRAALLSESPTAGNRPTTASAAAEVFGADLGMFHITAAVAKPGGDVLPATLDGGVRASIRSAFACADEALLFGQEAWNLRTRHPEWLAHCLQLYIGRAQVDRLVAGKKCPPEVLIALMLKHVFNQSWNRKGRPAAAAVTVPACYDQLHRRSIRLAASIAGLPACRLVDRPLAAAYSQLMPDRAAADPPRQAAICHWLTVSVAGNAMEVCLLRHLGGRLQCLATSGNWGAGVLAWQQRLLDLAAEDHRDRHGFDPRSQLRSAASLQMGCESAVRALLLQPETQLRFHVNNRQVALPVSRELFTAACADMLTMLQEMIESTIQRAGVAPEQISRCLLIGSLARFPAVTKAIRRTLETSQLIPIDQTSIACGIAGAVADGFTEGTEPLQGCAAHDIGVLVWDDVKGRHRAATVIPSGATLPAKTARRLRPSNQSHSNSLTFVESADHEQKAWRALGSCRLDDMLQAGAVESRFTLDTSGLLHIGIGNPQEGGRPVPAMPEPTIPSEDVEGWRSWVESLVGTPAEK